MNVKEYRVRAVRWEGEHGWELHLDEDRGTQSRTLAEAERVVRDYLTIDGESDAVVVIDPELDERTRTEIDSMRTTMDSAQRAQIEARDRYRHLIDSLKQRGLSAANIARVLKISRGRVSQLTKDR